MGDFGARFHRPESGIHTVEGNVAGSRAAELTKKRQREQQEFEEKKRKIQEQSQKSSTMHDKFATTQATASEQAFRAQTVGLVTAEEFKRAARRQHEEQEETTKEKQPTPEEQERQRKSEKKARKKKLMEKKKMMSTLSFATEDDLVEEEESTSAKRSLKDPTVDTSFLPDKQREEEQERERQRLEQEWKEKQQEMKKQPLEITYSYWDGSGHRRSVQCLKGDTIGDFLEKVRKDLCKEFRELTSTSSDALVYVKEDLMIPNDLTFYDLIVTKARGKSGPLFHFDIHDDVRVGAIDARVEKEESHPGKVVERRWYDRNKHIFPASRWEVFDPSKTYGKYTIHGGEINKSK
jgi:protein FAM50